MTKDLKVITKQFFAAYDAHNVDGMLALCAGGAQGRYVPYGKNSVIPIRGGLEMIWRGFPQAVPDFGAEIVEMIEAQDNTVVVQALVGGTMPADVPGVVKKGGKERQKFWRGVSTQGQYQTRMTVMSHITNYRNYTQ